jgi:hypothetical protein
MPSGIDSEPIVNAMVITLKLTIFYVVLIWAALGLWTFRDIRHRSRNGFVQGFSVLLTLSLFLPGYWLYLILRPQRERLNTYKTDQSKTQFRAERRSSPPLTSSTNLTKEVRTSVSVKGQTLQNHIKVRFPHHKRVNCG